MSNERCTRPNEVIGLQGAHDIGGMHGFGRIEVDPDEPVFHEEWERHAFAVLMSALCQGVATADENRYAIERMGNIRYLTTSYYEHWLAAMETVLVEKNVITAEELAQRREAALKGEVPPLPPSTGEDELAKTLREIIATGGRTDREIDRLPRFAVGDAVATTTRVVPTHVRLPAYARGRRGTIEACHGAHVLPDTNSCGRGESPEPLYTVRFDARELWGTDYSHGDCMHVDLWESYLSPADTTEEVR